MCGRYTLTPTDRGSLGIRFGVDLPEDFDSLLGRYNAAPGQEILIIRFDEDDGRAPSAARWGLVPAWADDLNVGYRMINARSESVIDSRVWAPLVKAARGRCLIPADGFFEWIPPPSGVGPKQPVRFTVDDGRPFSLAGLVTEREWEGHPLISVSILTKGANAAVSEVHDRMPVILSDSEAEDRWLDPSVGWEGILPLLDGVGPERVHSAMANPALNKVGAVPEGPDLLRSPG